MCLARSLVLILLAVAAGSIPASTQDAKSAKAFLAEIYRHYGSGGEGINYTEAGASRYYHSSLIGLMEADLKANGPEYVPAVDWDPLCGCQDWDGIFELKIDVQLQGPQRALAIVSFDVFDPKDKNSDPDGWVKLKIQLRVEHGGWRIYDILDMSPPSGRPVDVRDLLIRDIESIKASRGKSPQH